MKQMGIKQEDIDASKVIIEKSDGGKILINNPSVVKVNMSGNESFQITGDISEEEEAITNDDINIVMEKTGASEEDARKALKDSNGDLTEAIMSLS